MVVLGQQRVGAISSPEREESNDLRILVVAPTSNDALLTVRFLEKANLKAVVCGGVREVCEKLEKEGCGAVLFAEEALTDESVDVLVAHLQGQPSWSDLPIIILSGRGEAYRMRPSDVGALELVGNVSMVERPVRPATLVSVCEVALRSRRRQYQVRDLVEELRESQARLHFALESAQVGDWDLNLLDDTSHRSLRHDQAFGYREPVEKWGYEIFMAHVHPEDRAEVAAKFDAAVAGSRDWDFECRVIWPDGTVHWIAGRGSLYSDARGRRTRMLGVVLDITARKEAERGLMEQAKALQEADRRKDEFLAMLAHELRNPLAAVANAAALLKSSNAEEHTWASEVIERQSGQLAHLIDDLLDVSRITTGKIRLRREVIDVARVLDRARDSVRPLMTERGHAFIHEYAGETLWIEADPTRMEQIVLNLLTNAAKYTPAGGKIELTAGQRGKEVRITVRDNGIGVAPQHLPEMFQLFAQGERSIARSEGGLGIGLTIVQRLVEMHGGRVEAYSEGLNRGSTFTIRLPLAVPGVAADRRKAMAAGTSQTGRRILIVDDNVDTAQAMAKLLARVGHTTALTHDGPRALQRAREFSPEAVLLDIGLPGMDGFEVVQRLRQECNCADALMVAVTGYGQPEDRQRAIKAGFDHHFVKPVDIEELKKLLSSGVSSSEGTEARDGE